VIDTYLRKYYQKSLVDPVLNRGFLDRVAPNFLTICALIFGLCVPIFMYLHYVMLAFAFMVISGLLDTLDGSLARKLGSSSKVGAALDIFSDRVVESAIVFGLFLYAPETRAMPCILLMISILLCITSFLVVGIFTENESEKGFHYSPGLIERSEAFIGFSLMMLFDSLFLPVAYLLSLLIGASGIQRLKQFHHSERRRL